MTIKFDELLPKNFTDIITKAAALGLAVYIVVEVANRDVPEWHDIVMSPVVPRVGEQLATSSAMAFQVTQVVHYQARFPNVETHRSAIPIVIVRKVDRIEV